MLVAVVPRPGLDGAERGLQHRARHVLVEEIGPGRSTFTILGKDGTNGTNGTLLVRGTVADLRCTVCTVCTVFWRKVRKVPFPGIEEVRALVPAPLRPPHPDPLGLE